MRDFNNHEITVSDVCQINEVDHRRKHGRMAVAVSDVCQINEVDHAGYLHTVPPTVSDVCQINEVDHYLMDVKGGE